MSETSRLKRYSGVWIGVCLGCGCLFDTGRRDALTCSPACRTRAHRSGELRRRRELASMPALQVHPAAIGHCQALEALRPDLEPAVASGAMTLEQAMPGVAAAYFRLAIRKAEGLSK